MQIENRHFAESILNITTAPVRLLDKMYVFRKNSQPVKAEGRWYNRLDQTTSPGSSYAELYWSKIVFYQNKDNSVVDMIGFIAEKSLAIRAYDYYQLENDGPYIPTKLEIFETDSTGLLKQRLAKIDYIK